MKWYHVKAQIGTKLQVSDLYCTQSTKQLGKSQNEINFYYIRRIILTEAFTNMVFQ